MKRIATIIILALVLTTSLISPASAALTWSQTSTLDTTFDGSLYNPQYDLEYTTAAIFDNNPDKINFYIEFLNVPTVNVFNTGNGAFGAIFLDYNFDNQADFALYAQDITLKTDVTGVVGLANVLTKGVNTYSSCAVSVFTNIAEGKKWIGLSTSRACIGLPISFGLLGLAKNNSKNSGKDYDFAPSTFFRVNLPTTSTGSSSTTTLPDVGATFTLPTSKANESKAASTYSDSPQDLSKLAEDLLPSVVTVQCDGGSGTGWSADVAMSSDLQAGGYKSLVVTNHHVIENCLTNKSVTLVLNSKASIPGVIVSWSKNDDIAGIAVKTTIPALQWMGVNPKQGWWVGVLGSPLGVSGILTTGIISSTNSIGSRFTFTAAINPGNSGGPVFDSTGRVLGLATSKRLISTDSIAEGFGNAQGTPLLCSVIVSCVIEKNPWNATPKYAASSSFIDKAAAEAEAKIAQDKAVADAKAAAEAEAKIAQDKAVADAKAAAELKAKQEAEKLAVELKAKQEADAKAAAELKAKQEADAKAAAELKAKQEADAKIALNTKVTSASYALDGLKIQILNLRIKYPAEKVLLSNYTEILNSFGVINELNYEIADSTRIRIQESVLALALKLSTQKITITCVKGKLVKKVTAVKPVCPAGYKKK